MVENPTHGEVTAKTCGVRSTAVEYGYPIGYPIEAPPITAVPLSQTGRDVFPPRENRAAAAALRQRGGQSVPMGVTGATPALRHTATILPPCVFLTFTIAAEPVRYTADTSRESLHDAGGGALIIVLVDVASDAPSTETTSQNASSISSPNLTATVAPIDTSLDDGTPTGLGGAASFVVVRSATAIRIPPI